VLVYRIQYPCKNSRRNNNGRLFVNVLTRVDLLLFSVKFSKRASRGRCLRAILRRIIVGRLQFFGRVIFGAAAVFGATACTDYALIWAWWQDRFFRRKNFPCDRFLPCYELGPTLSPSPSLSRGVHHYADRQQRSNREIEKKNGTQMKFKKKLRSEC